MIKKPLFLIFLYVFVDVLGFSLILPLLPFYAETFDATPALVGLLLGANALAQFIGAVQAGIGMAMSLEVLGLVPSRRYLSLGLMIWFTKMLLLVD